ncbi:MAG: VOC family protein, partial [Phycisphaerales bacterium]
GLFQCKDGQGSRDPRPAIGPDFEQYGGTWMSWWVTDVDAAHAECKAADIEIVKPPVNEPWGVREFLIRHPDGHFFRVSGAVR